MEEVLRTTISKPGIGSAMTSRQNEILNEANRINESVELSSVQHFIAAQCWRSVHFILGIIATIAATIATALIFAKVEALWPGLLAIAVAIITGLITFLHPKHHADTHHGKGVDYQQVGAKARILVKIECPQTDDEKHLVNQLKALYEEQFDLDRRPPSTPGSVFYRLAKRSMARGETRFRVD